MSRSVSLYVARSYLIHFVVVFVVVWTIFLTADLGDRANLILAHRLEDAVALYFNKALVAALQIGPAALLLAASSTVASLRKKNEWTALQALTFTPKAVYFPIAMIALLGSLGWFVFDEWVATRAGQRVDELMANRFNRRGDWNLYYSQKQWFRKGNRIFHLRHGDVSLGFEDVTVLTVDENFRLVSRVDAKQMLHQEKTTWILKGATERRFDGGKFRVLYRGDVQENLEISNKDLKIRRGRPEQMTMSLLREQIQTRGAVGLSTRQFELALHNRLAYPLTGFAAVLLAVGWALRRGTKVQLTSALVEGFGLSIALWCMLVIGKSLVLSDRIDPSWAAWAPLGAVMVLAVRRWLTLEGVRFSFGR